MDGIEGLLARDFGVRPQGKAAPMAASRAAGSTWPNPRSTSTSTPSAAPSYDDLFGAPAASASSLDSLFESFKGPTTTSSSAAKTKPAPAPAYDDNIFDAIPGLRASHSTSSTARYDGDDVVAGNRSAPPSYDDLLEGFGGKPQAEERKRSVVIEEDDLLGGFGRKPQAEDKKKPVVVEEDLGGTDFDDLIPGFASRSPPRSRKTNDDENKKPAVPTSKSTASTGRFTDPLEDLDKSANSERNIMPKSQSARYSDIHVDDSVPSSERYSGNGMEDQSPRSTESEDDIWLTVSEIPLLTRPTSAPPPSRSPPLLKLKPLGAKANGKPQMPAYDNNVFDDDEEFERNSSDREEKERQERLEQAREMRLREEKERETRKLEKERELEQQRKRERERQAMERATKEARERAAAEARAKAEREAHQRAQRAAVQRAQQEARERAAAEAKERAARAAAEERERAAAEERERAAAEAKERERAAAEAKERERATTERAAAERVQQEARKRAERAAMERVAAAARERQAAAAAAAAAAREKQSTADDLESFFGVDARASSAPKQRSPTVDSMFDPQPQGRGTVNGSQRAASTSASTRKASSATNIGDDLFDIFGAPASSEVFQEVEGESEERRRARLERHQRTRERAAKALAEKNERDMQVQREQAERDRIADTLDFEVKRWAAGKEGNLRALLSTLQYILWPECGWQAVSLTDLITGAAVKKQYRKATLCIHPDKVQQKGATLQQKYTAEKVFDILKEAWNKLNSEELF